MDLPVEQADVPEPAALDDAADPVVEQVVEDPVVAAPAVPAGHPALTVPDADPMFWVSPSNAQLLFHLGRLSSKGERINVLLTGPKGTGKTSLPREFAAACSFPFFTVHCQLIAERDDWWGSKELSMERGTYFDKAAFLDAVETPHCVILLDEANRTHPENLNALFGFLDHRRSAWVPALKREVQVAEGVVFFVTLNEGFEYVGTNPVDEALRDRMTYSIRMQYVRKSVEKGIIQARTGVPEEVADKLCEFAKRVRRNTQHGIPVSTRQLLGAASLVAEGMTLPQAVQFGVINSLGDGVDRQSLLQALQIIGNVSDAYVEGRTEDDDDDDN
jgi:nitric oxide reductase NorQ protein